MAAVQTRHAISDDRFNRFFWISAIVHSSLFIGVAVKNIIAPSDVTVIQNAVRVDIVALPDKAEPEVGPKPTPQAAPEPVAPPTPKPPTPAPAVPKKAAVDTKKKIDPKQAQKEALNRLKQQDALERLSKKTPNESNAPPAPKKNLNAGNQLSQGDSVTGLERIAFDEYISQIKGTVNSNFTIPSWLADAKNKASVEVTLDGSGRVTKRVLTRSSGNQTFDNAALTAIDASNPFPPVPERLTRGWGSFTIQFNFPDN